VGMSDEHKAAIAKGREENRAIKDYLSATTQRKPGRPVTAASVKAKLDGIEAKLAAESDAMKRLGLIQSRRDALAQLATLGESVDLTALEAGFVRHAKAYSERKGISYGAWREAGVPAPVLKAAGIARTRG
jgi:hypothetical protein